MQSAPPDPGAAERAASALRAARRILVITGAGISADAGLPTYRGVGGLYNDVPAEAGFAIEEILSGPMFDARPELTWKYLHQIERAGRGAAPSPGHRILAAMDQDFNVMVLTQNVDGLHRKAGSRDIVDIHGDFQRLFCPRCGWEEIVGDYAHLSDLPQCPACQGVIRPDVVLFGEMLPLGKLQRLREAQAQRFDMVLSIGTSSLFPYIVEPVLQARETGCPTIEINPQATDVSALVDIRFASTASAALQAIWDRYRAMV